MVALPSGQVLVVGAESNGTLWLYKSNGDDAQQRVAALDSVGAISDVRHVCTRWPAAEWRLTNGADFGDDGKDRLELSNRQADQGERP